MKKTIYVFEDSGFENLLPLVYTMPVWDILCGIKTLLEKIKMLYPGADIRLLCRDYLAETVRKNTGLPVNEFASTKGQCLFINGRAVLNKAISADGNEEAAFNGETLIYARVKAGRVNEEMFLKNRVPEPLLSLKKVEIKTRIINYFWDAVELLPGQIMSDFSAVAKKAKKKLYIGRKTTIKPGVVLDVDNGPVYIGSGVMIEPNAVIEGPAAIGDGSIVRACTVIKGSSIGRDCRIGGEVNQSIIHSYSNKQHGGYLGNSYIGQWVNIGAGTNNSDLKNNYGNVKVLVNDKVIDTGRLHVGALIAGHSKCAVGTNFNCGTIVGVCSNVFGKPMPPKSIKSFAWGENEVYGIEAAVSTIRKVMKRRNVVLSPAEETLIRHIFKLTRL